MSAHTYKVTEICFGSSSEGIDDAVRSGIARAGRSRCEIWAGSRSPASAGTSEDGAVAYFQVTMKVGFRLEDD